MLLLYRSREEDRKGEIFHNNVDDMNIFRENNGCIVYMYMWDVWCKMGTGMGAVVPLQWWDQQSALCSSSSLVSVIRGPGPELDTLSVSEISHWDHTSIHHQCDYHQCLHLSSIHHTPSSTFAITLVHHKTFNVCIFTIWILSTLVLLPRVDFVSDQRRLSSKMLLVYLILFKDIQEIVWLLD